MQIFTFRSHKRGQGTTAAASAAASALAAAGHRVALVSNDPDAFAILGCGEPDGIATETAARLFVIDVRGQAIDPVALAGLCGLSDMPEPRYDVVVTDLGDETPTRTALASVWLCDVQAVEVVTTAYLAMRRSVQAHSAAGNAAGDERTHVAAVMLQGSALTVGDVRSVLNPAGEIIEIPHDAAAARQIDAGLLLHRLPKAFDALAAWVEGMMIDPATYAAADRELAALKARRATK